MIGGHSRLSSTFGGPYPGLSAHPVRACTGSRQLQAMGPGVATGATEFAAIMLSALVRSCLRLTASQAAGPEREIQPVGLLAAPTRLGVSGLEDQSLARRQHQNLDCTLRGERVESALLLDVG